jgi:Fe-S cluster assembly iron-binding protein IscA
VSRPTSGTTEIFDERNPTVLTLTDNAASEIRNLVASPEVPEDAGVRIASNPEGALTLALASGPADGDSVVDQAGARVFLEPQAEELLDDKQLDAGVDPQGNVQFSLGQRV